MLSHRGAHADHLLTVRALVLLIVARVDAEWNEAAAKPALEQAEDEA